MFKSQMISNKLVCQMSNLFSEWFIASIPELLMAIDILQAVSTRQFMTATPDRSTRLYQIFY